jgi:hypothetical protein
MRSWRTVHKRASNKRRRIERERQREWAIAFTKADTFLHWDKDIQEYWLRHVVGTNNPLGLLSPFHVKHTQL